VLGEHPLVATRADTGEVLHLRQRKGSAGSGRGAQRFVRETIGRSRRAGATAQLTLGAGSGFHSKHVVNACRGHDVRYSITVNKNNAVVELAIRDLNGGSGHGPLPAGDLHRRCRLVGARHPGPQPDSLDGRPRARTQGHRGGQTIRRKYITMPSRLTHRS
jgi:hypothetical protein